MSWGQAMIARHSRPHRPGHAGRRGRRGAVRGELPAGLVGRARCSASSIAQHHRGWPKFFAGDIDGAEEDFAEALDTSLAMRHDEGIAYGLEGLAAVRAAQGNAEQTGLLLGAAQRLRRRTGVVNPAGFSLYAPLVDALREGGASEALDAAIAEGADLPVSEVVARVTADAARRGIPSTRAGHGPRARRRRGSSRSSSSRSWWSPRSCCSCSPSAPASCSHGRSHRPLSAYMLASAYVGGIWFFVGVALTHRVASRRPGFPRRRRVRRGAAGRDAPAPGPVLAESVVLHLGRLLYATTPFVVAWLWWLQRRSDDGAAETPDVRVPLVVRVVMLAVGAASLVTGAILFLAPTLVIPIWAWDLTPLTARVLGAVLSLPGVVAVGFLRDDRWSSFRILFQAQLVSLVAIVCSLIAGREALHWDRLATPAFLALIAVAFVGYADTDGRDGVAPAARVARRSVSLRRRARLGTRVQSRASAPGVRYLICSTLPQSLQRLLDGQQHGRLVSTHMRLHRR